MPERRFDDDEIRDILARATEVRAEVSALPAPAATHGHGHGLTLAELQDVAAEAGIAPDRVAEAALALERDQAVLPAPRTQLGVVVSSSHVVRLPRMLRPDEWDRFVVRLRDTFDEAGEVRTEGSLQSWTTGHLQVLLEPLDQGARLRFQSLENDAKQYLDAGLAMGASGVILAVLLSGLTLLTGKPLPVPLFGMSAVLPAIGAALWAVGRSRAHRLLPRSRAGFQALGEEALRVVDAERGRIGPSGT